MMRRAEVVEYNKPLVINEYPIPDPPPKGLVLKTSFAGICHTDVHLWEDDFNLGDGKSIRFKETIGPKHLPLTMGHEIAGIVHSLGPEDDHDADPTLKVGDRVALYPWLGCGNCGICDSHEPNLCPDLTNSLGMVAVGGYSSYIACKAKRHAVKVPDNVPLDVACTFTCSALTTYNAVSATKDVLEKIAKATGKATLLVIGAGGLGLWCLQIAKAVLPQNVKILSADVSDEKLKVALERGAEGTVLWNKGICEEDALKAVRDAAGDQFIDAAIDLVGRGETLGRATQLVRKGGVVVPVGLFGGKLEVGVPHLVFNVVTISARYVGDVPQMKEVIRLAAEGKIVSPPLTHCRLEDANDVLEKLRKGKITGRMIIKY